MQINSYIHAPCWLCVSAPVAQTYTLFDFALLAAAVLLIPIQSIILGRNLARTESQSALLRRYRITILRAVAIVVSIIALWKLTGRSLVTLGLGAPNSLGSLAGFGLVPVLAVVFAIQHKRLATRSPEEITKLAAAVRAKKLAPRNLQELSAFLVVAVTGSFSEELLFRGFLLWFFAPVFGVAGAVLSSGLIFGLAHAYQGRGNSLRTGILGALFAAAYLASGNLWWLIAVHVMMNILGGLFPFRVLAMSGRHQSNAALVSV